YGLNPISQHDELAIDLVQFAAFELETQILTTQRESMTSRVFAQHQGRAGHSYRLRRHDLISERVLDDTVLVDPCFVRESIASDDGLVRLHRHSGDLRQKLACGKELFTENRRAEWVTIRTNPHGHHELLQGRVAGAFTDAVNRALRLPHSGTDGSERIRHR